MDDGVAPGPELQGYLGLVNGLRGPFGLARISRLEALGRELMAEAELAYASTGQKQRQFGRLD